VLLPVIAETVAEVKLRRVVELNVVVVELVVIRFAPLFFAIVTGV